MTRGVRGRGEGKGRREESERREVYKIHRRSIVTEWEDGGERYSQGKLLDCRRKHVKTKIQF